MNSVASLLVPPPRFPVSKPVGSKARGAAYERKVGKWLQAHIVPLGLTLYDHPWLALPDGRKAQPDFVLESASGCKLVVEAKLTLVDCRLQLAKYRLALGPCVCVQVARRTLPGRAVLTDFLDASPDSVVLLWI